MTGPSDRTFLPIVDYLLYAGGMNRVFRLAGGAGAMVATGLFLAELGAGLCLVVGAIRSKRRWRWTGLLASASLCLMLGLSGASRLTALLSALTITVSALHATVRPRHRDAA